MWPWCHYCSISIVGIVVSKYFQLKSNIVVEVVLVVARWLWCCSALFSAVQLGGGNARRCFVYHPGRVVRQGDCVGCGEAVAWTIGVGWPFLLLLGIGVLLPCLFQFVFQVLSSSCFQPLGIIYGNIWHHLCYWYNLMIIYVWLYHIISTLILTW